MRALPTTRRHAALLALAAALFAVAADGSAVAGRSGSTAVAATPPARVVAIAPVGRGWRLTLLDARTLKTVRPGWSRAVPQETPAVLSPRGSRVAIGVEGDGGARVLVLDASSGKRLGNEPASSMDEGFYWLGGDGTKGSGEPLLVTESFMCGSGTCGGEYGIVGSEGSSVYDNLETYATLKTGLMLGSGPTSLMAWPGETEFRLPKMPPSSPFRVVADVAHGTAFVVSSGGLVAKVGAKVAYHRVPLNGKEFEAAWAGSGKIALWGEDGLGTIDTRTWTTHAIAPGVTGALATPYGIAAWTKTPDGIAVYRTDGSRRLQLLAGKQVKTAVTVGAYLYADTSTGARYSVDLRTGKTTGPLPPSAQIVIPSYAVIP
jgi:hypothetical protein